MAGGIEWFRWHHGSVTDPKFQLVARRSGASLPDVLAVWAYLLETASAAAERGSFGEIDCESLDCLFNFPNTETRTSDILKAMQDRGLTDGSRIVQWAKRQPKREREEATTSTERVRKLRDTKRHETPRNAKEGSETPREEKSREEVIKPPHPPAGGAFARFWEAWPKHPRKVARPQCERKWRSTGCDAMADQILTALEAAKRSEDWRKDDGGFIPAPLVWLNQARWEAPTKVELEPVGPDIAEQTRAMLEAKRLTPEEKAASEAARLRVMAAVKRVA